MRACPAQLRCGGRGQGSKKPASSLPTPSGVLDPMLGWLPLYNCIFCISRGCFPKKKKKRAAFLPNQGYAFEPSDPAGGPSGRLPGAGGEVDPQIEGGAGTETGARGGRVGEGLLVRTCSAQGPHLQLSRPLLVSPFLLHFDSGDDVAGPMLSAAGRAECSETQRSCSVSSAWLLSVCPSGHPPIQSSIHSCPSTHSAHTSWVDSVS